MNCREPDCTNPIAYTFVWPWGEQDAVCAAHAPLAQQLATNLNTTITLHPVTVTVPTPPPDVAECLAQVAALEAALVELRADLVTANQLAEERAAQFRALDAEHAQTMVRVRVYEVEVPELRRVLTTSDDERLNLLARIQAAREELEELAPDSLDLSKPFPPPEVVEG